MHFLNKTIRLKTFFLIFLIFVTSIFEFLSISFLPIVFSYFANTEIFYQDYIKHFYDFFNQFIILSFEYFLILITITFFTFKYVSGIFTYYFFANIYSDIKVFLTGLVIKKIYSWPFEKIKKITSTILLRRTVVDTDIYLQQNILPTFNLFSDIFLSIPILLLCLLINPILFIFIIFIIFLILFLLYPLLRYGSAKWGKIKMFEEELRHKKTQQFFLNMKQIIIDNLFNYFSSKINESTTNSARAESKQIYFQYFPKLTIEFLSILIFMGIVLFYFQFMNDSKDFINTIVIYGIAALRILPNINRIFGSLQSIKFSTEAKKNIYEIIFESNQYIKKNKKKNLSLEDNSSNNLITLKNVDVGFSKSKLIKNINLSFPNKGIIAIYGESGVGKTTLLETVMGLIKPSKGKIFFNNKNIIQNKDFFHKNISYVSQDKILDNESMFENIVLDRKELSSSINEIKLYLKNFKLDDFTKNKFLFDKNRIGEFGNKLSEGQKQRTLIIRSLIKKPLIIFLDEPTSALDSENKKILTDFLKILKKEILIIIVSHDKDISKISDKNYLIKNFKLNETNQIL